MRKFLLSGALLLIAMPAGASGIFASHPAIAAESGVVEAAEPGKQPESQKQIQSALDKFSNAWDLHDPNAMAASFENTGTLVNPAGRAANGKTAIQELFASEQTGEMKDTKFVQTIDQVRMIGKDAAFVDVAIQITGMKGPDGADVPAQTYHGIYLMTKKKVDRTPTWKVLDARAFMMQPLPSKPGSL